MNRSLLELCAGCATEALRITVIAPDGMVDELDGASLWRRAGPVSTWLQARCGGAPVGALLTNTTDCLVLVFAAVRAGLRLVSLPLPTPRAEPGVYVTQLDAWSAATGCAVLCAEARFAALLGDALPSGVAVVGFGAWGDGVSETTDREGFELVQFSSGTTREPAPLLCAGDAVAAHVAALVDVIDPSPNDVLCSWLPLAHDMGLVGTFFTGVAAAAAGRANKGHLVLLHPEGFVRRPSSWLRALTDFGATITAAPPTALRAVLPNASMRGLDLRTLRLTIIGAEPISPDLLERFTDAFAPVGFRGASLSPAYGMAEVGVAVSLVRPADHWRVLSGSTDEGTRVSAVGCGRAIPGLEFRVESGTDELGRIMVRGASVAQGLAGPLDALDANGWLRTGDVGFVIDGELAVVGRIDDNMVLAGRNIAVGPVEEVLFVRSQPFAKAVLVVGVDNSYDIVVELDRRHAPSAADIDTLRRVLSASAFDELAQRPRTVVIVAPNSLPRTASGKLRRTEIARSVLSESLASLD